MLQKHNKIKSLIKVIKLNLNTVEEEEGPGPEPQITVYSGKKQLWKDLKVRGPHKTAKEKPI